MEIHSTGMTFGPKPVTKQTPYKDTKDAVVSNGDSKSAATTTAPKEEINPFKSMMSRPSNVGMTKPASKPRKRVGMKLICTKPDSHSSKIVHYFTPSQPVQANFLFAALPPPPGEFKLSKKESCLTSDHT